MGLKGEERGLEGPNRRRTVIRESKVNQTLP